ncbi:hypothetical protein GCK32_021918, partial [Trichostrongylus colubriformis]
AAVYAGQLHDAFYAYAVAVNRTLTSGFPFSSGRHVAGHFRMEFQGVSGKVVLGPNGTRYPTFYFDALDKNYKVQALGSVFVDKFTGVSRFFF